MEKNDAKIIDNKAELGLFDMVVECVSDHSEEALCGEKTINIKEEAELSFPSTSSQQANLNEKPGRRKRITRIIYIEEESDFSSSSSQDEDEFIPQITIIRKICPRESKDNSAILNTIERNRNLPIAESCSTDPVIFMQKTKASPSVDDDPVQLLDHDLNLSPEVKTSLGHDNLGPSSELGVEGVKESGTFQFSVSVMQEEDSAETNKESLIKNESQNEESVSLISTAVDDDDVKKSNRSTAFKVGAVHFAKLKGEILAIELFRITKSVLEEWQSLNSASVKKYCLEGLKDWERDLFVSVSEDLFEGNTVLVKDLCSRGNGLKSFHMVDDDCEKGLTKEWALKWCQAFEIGFERDPLEYIEDLEELPLEYPGVINLEVFAKNQDGTLFKEENQAVWDGECDMPVLEKFTQSPCENDSPHETCEETLSPILFEQLSTLKEKKLLVDDCSKSLTLSSVKEEKPTEVNNNSLKDNSPKDISNDSNLSRKENKNSEEVKNSDTFRISVVAYAHENGAKAASVTFEVTEDEVKRWCWSGRYRKEASKVQVKKKDTHCTALSLSSALSLENSSANVHGIIQASDDVVKNQRPCSDEMLTPLSMGLITTRSQQKSQGSKPDTENFCNSSSQSVMKTRNSSKKMDQNSSPNGSTSSPSSRTSSPNSRKRNSSPINSSSSCNKKEEPTQTRLTRQSNKLLKLDFDKPSTSSDKPSEIVSSRPSRMKTLIPRTFGYVPTEYSLLHSISNSVVSSYSLRSKRISKSSDGSRKVVERKSERQSDIAKSAYSLRQKVVEFARQNGVPAAADNFKLDLGKVKHWSVQSEVHNICQARLRMSTRGVSSSVTAGPKMVQGHGDTEKMPVFDNYPACYQKRAILLADSVGKDEAAKEFGIPQSVLTDWIANKESVFTLSRVENVSDWEVDLFIEIHKLRLNGVGMTLEELLDKGNSKSRVSKNSPKLGEEWAFDFCERFGVTLKENVSDVENESTSECGILNNVGLQRLSVNETRVQKKEPEKSAEETVVSNTAEELNSNQKSTRSRKPNGLVKRATLSQNRQRNSNALIDKESSKSATVPPPIVNIKHDLSKVKTEPKSPESEEKDDEEHSSGKLVVTIKKEQQSDEEKYSIVVPPKVHSTRSSTQNSARTNYARLNSGAENYPLFRAAKYKFSTSDASVDELIDEEPPKPKRRRKTVPVKPKRTFPPRKTNNYFQKQYMQGSKRYYSPEFKNSVLEYAVKNGICAAANHFKICVSMITYWDVSSKITKRNKPGLSYCSSVKNEVLEFVKTGSCYDAAIKYRVSPAVVFKWKADQKRTEEQSPNNLALQALNQQMLEWYKDCKLKGNSLRKSIIMSKAKSVSSQLNYMDFTADEEWYKNWMKDYVEKEEEEKSIERRKSSRKPVPKVQNPNIIYLPTRRGRSDKLKESTLTRRNLVQEDSDSQLSNDAISTTSSHLDNKSMTWVAGEEESRSDFNQEDLNSLDYEEERNQVWLCQEAENFSSLKKRMTCPTSSATGNGDTNEADQAENYSADFKLMVASFAQASDVKEAAEKFELDEALVLEWYDKREEFENSVNPYFKKPQPAKTVVGYFLNWFREVNINSQVMTVHKVLHKVDQIVQKFGGKKNLNSSKWFYKWYDGRLEKIRHIPECDLLQAEDNIEGGSRIRYPAAFKLEFLKYVERRNILEACQAFQVSRHLFSNWKKKKSVLEMLCQSGKAECNRYYNNKVTKDNDSTDPSDNEEPTPDLVNPDNEIHEWYKKYISDSGGPPKFDMLKRKANELYVKYDQELTNPATWYYQFCKNFKISEKFVGDPETLEFVLKQFDQNVTLSQKDLLSNAIDIIRQKKPNFVGSSGWVHRFIRRYPHLVQEVPSVSEMLPASLETCVTNFRKSMKEIQNEGLFLPLAIGSMDEVPLSFPKINLSGPLRPSIRDCGDKHASGVVMLSCLSDGRILPPLIILKSDMEKEESEKCGNRLIIYQKDIQMDSEVILKWLRDIWLCHVPIPNLLVLDYYYPHTSTAVQQFTSESGVRLVIVPGGCSSKLHPVAAGIRRRFEYLIREQWLRHQGKTYKYVVPSAELILEWVTSAHQQLLTETELAKRSFVVTGIASSGDDENQDHLVGDESYLFANGRPFL